MKIEILEALRDNYIFVLTDPTTQTAAVVDPADANVVIHALKERNLSLTAILLTHHHADHTGGVANLKQHFPNVRVYGSKGESRITETTHPVEPGEILNICGENVKIMDVKAHTRSHIAWNFEDSRNLFSGDTIFGGTCGAIFEGTPRDMFEALVKIIALPSDTRIWCSHEYTAMFLPEAQRIDPNNTAIAERIERTRALREANTPTVPLLLKEELETNPFLRFNNPKFAATLDRPPGWETFQRLIEISG
jgi:hydroxyacylglutathione hydrolase